MRMSGGGYGLAGERMGAEINALLFTRQAWVELEAVSIPTLAWMRREVIIARETELRELNAHLTRAAGGRGGLVLLAGEAGVGKTHLAEAAIAQSGLTALRGNATQRRPAPYAPIVAALRDHLRAGGSFAGCGPLTGALATLLPELGGATDPPDVATMFEAIGCAFEEAAGAGATVVYLDDLHWADAATLELLPALAAAATRCPLLVLGAYRSDELARGHLLRRIRVELRRGGHIAELDIDALDSAATAELTEHLLGQPIGPVLSETIYERTQGVPFFVEELVAALARGDHLIDDAKGVEIQLGAATPMPDSIRDAVRLRTEGLSAGARKSLEAAAAVGVSIPLGVLSAIACDDGVPELLEAEILTPASAGTVTFRHDLAREAVASDTPWQHRRTIHRELASVLQAWGAGPQLVAEHWLAAGETLRARTAFVQAADRFRAMHAHRDAITAGRAALDVWPEGLDEPDRARALDALGQSAQLCGELGEAARAWEEAAAAIDPEADLPFLAELKRNLAGVYDLLGRHDEGADAHAAAAGAFAGCGRDAEASMARLLAARRVHVGHPTTALALADLAIDDARRAGLPGLESRGRSFKGLLLARVGRYTEGSEAVKQALTDALAGDDSGALVDAYWNLGTMANHWADPATAVSAFESGAGLCRSLGNRPHETTCLGCLGLALFEGGEWDRAVVLARNILDSPEARQDARAHACCCLGLVSSARGATKRARSFFERALSVAAKQGMSSTVVQSTVGLALVDELEGRPSPRWLRLLDAPPVLLSLSYAAGLRWAATFSAGRGDAARVQKCADGAAAWASRFGTADSLAALAHTVGETLFLAGSPDRAATQFLRGVDLLDNTGNPFAAAYTKLRAGVALVSAGDHDRGVSHIVDCYRVFRKLGARPFWQQAAVELDSLGEQVDRRLGRRAAGDLERNGLTRRELQVLRLVAAGQTNKDIALELFLSVRTVEVHVGNTLSKLACRSRMEAANRARELGLLGDRQ